MTIGGVFAWILFGFVVGLIARFVMPGVQRLGWIGTIALGVAGSFAGGFIASLFQPGRDPLHQPAGWIMSIIGAMILLWIAGALAKRR